MPLLQWDHLGDGLHGWVFMLPFQTASRLFTLSSRTAVAAMDTIGSVRGQICPPSLSFMFTIFLCLLGKLKHFPITFLEPEFYSNGINCLGCRLAASVDGDTEFDLMNTLLVNYDKRVIPRKNDHPLLVSIGFSLIQVHSLVCYQSLPFTLLAL